MLWPVRAFGGDVGRDIGQPPRICFLSGIRTAADRKRPENICLLSDLMVLFGCRPPVFWCGRSPQKGILPPRMQNLTYKICPRFIHIVARRGRSVQLRFLLHRNLILIRPRGESTLSGCGSAVPARTNLTTCAMRQPRTDRERPALRISAEYAQRSIKIHFLFTSFSCVCQ